MIDDSGPNNRVERLARWAIWIAGATALLYLILEHRPHLFGWLPYLLIAACPLMHFFMHRGHHRDRNSRGPEAGHRDHH
jgi:Protein of unknown function (DUF2933)